MDIRELLIQVNWASMLWIVAIPFIAITLLMLLQYALGVRRLRRALADTRAEAEYIENVLRHISSVDQSVLVKANERSRDLLDEILNALNRFEEINTIGVTSGRLNDLQRQLKDEYKGIELSANAISIIANDGHKKVSAALRLNAPDLDRELQQLLGPEYFVKFVSELHDLEDRNMKHYLRHILRRSCQPNQIHGFVRMMQKQFPNDDGKLKYAEDLAA